MAKEAMNKVKRQSIDWKKVFANHIPLIRGPISKIQEEFDNKNYSITRK
jgi:hypothetical protein